MHYNTERRDSIRLIAHLQEPGFSTPAIRETLDRLTEGRSLASVLGVSRIAVGLEREPARMSPEEFSQRFAGVEITQVDIQRAVRIGLVELDGAEVLVPNEAFIDLGAAVARMGIPVTEILNEHEALMITVNGIAERFREILERNSGNRTSAGMPAEGMTSLTAAASRLPNSQAELKRGNTRACPAFAPTAVWASCELPRVVDVSRGTGAGHRPRSAGTFGSASGGLDPKLVQDPISEWTPRQCLPWTLAESPPRVQNAW